MLKLIFSSFIFFFCLNANTEQNLDFSDNTQYSQYSYGGVGLIETPTARFSPDGEFLFGISSSDTYRRVYSKMQFLPWIEAVLKYTEGTWKPYGAQTWKDKGIDLKFRLFEESAHMPGLAVGINDFGGTGAYSSEYIVATKHAYDVDWTIGLGWGRLAGVNNLNNPFSWIDEGRSIRGKGSSILGGSLNIGRLFSGDVSIFGGFEYFTPIDNLSIKLEYDTSDYSNVIGREKVFNERGDIFELDSRINYALNYRYDMSDRDKLDLSLGFVRGNTIYANFAVHSNLNFKGAPKVIIGAEKIRNSNLPEKSYEELDQRWKSFLTNRIIKEMANVGFITHKVIFNGNELAAEISQARFFETSKFIDLASRVLANNALQNIDTVTVINIDQGIETMRSSVNREKLKKAVSKGPLPEEYLVFNDRAPINDALIVDNEFMYPNFYWEIKPHLNTTIQHQQRFFFWQLEALIHTEYAFKKGLYLSTDIGIDIANNFDEYTYHIPDGKLFHVRQNRRLFLTEGETGLRRMAIDYLVDLHPNVKAKFSAGYLEWMFGGVGGEILYMPDHKRWALGLDTHWVKQRDFDQKLGFQDYTTVTGFLSYYQDLPFYNFRLKLNYGKFLGKDVGTMIEVSRRFETGARVGAFVALTDCNPACVGEGSFHKGIYFELPMDLFYSQSSTRREAGYMWAPLTKDAGSRIDGSGSLYNVMTHASDEIDSIRLKQWSFKKIFSGFGMKPQVK